MASINIFKRASNKYLYYLDKYPWRTQIIQTGILMGAGDIIAQVFIERNKSIDPIRVGRFVFIGTVQVAPSVRVWYHVLERIFPKPGLASSVKKMVLDQGAFAPIFTGAFMVHIGLLQGQSFEDIKRGMKEDYWDIMFTGWKIWPAAQVLNFSVVPLELRPLFVSFVALFWNTYLAWKTNSSPHDDEEEGKDD